jgi:anti-sigma-K factor RskA
VPHVDPEVIALIALGENAGSADDRDHLAECGHCQRELHSMTAVVGTARRGTGEERLVSPPAELWSRIASHPEVGSAERAPGSLGEQVPRPAGIGTGRWAPGPRAWRRRPIVVAVAGVLAGALLALGGVAIVHLKHEPPAAHVVARIPLHPLPQFPQWRTASGNAVMENGSGGLRLRVTVHAPSRPGFFEVWLLARNGVSMISLGDLNHHQTGEFTMPPGVDLGNYSRVDVSLQPFNGSTAHSKESVVRGALPS